MHPRLLIRNGEPSDAGNLAALAIQVWLHTYATEGISTAISRYVLSEFTDERFTTILSQESSVILVAEIDGHLVGYALLDIGARCPSGDSAVELATLYVQEHFTREGIGSALLACCRNVAHKRTGSGRIWLTVNARNEPAIAFYRKHGFIRTGTDWFELGGERHENHLMVGPES
jgi:ribosomal protein S18 acetylase RimI-like enzyme